jgi:hypothetical protein
MFYLVPLTQNHAINPVHVTKSFQHYPVLTTGKRRQDIKDPAMQGTVLQERYEVARRLMQIGRHKKFK